MKSCFVDRAIGQEAADLTKSFHESVNFRGNSNCWMETQEGGCFIYKKISGKPIKFIGVGENRGIATIPSRKNG